MGRGVIIARTDHCPHAMNLRFAPGNRVLPACMALLLAWAVLSPVARAADVYKWIDANGQVHFGDRVSGTAPGQKMDIKAPPPPPPPATAEPRVSPTVAPPRTASPAGPVVPVLTPLQKGASLPVDPSQVRPGCQALIDQIVKVKPGTNWQSLYQQFDATCPGIGYECNNYRSRPEKNQCIWVKRTGGNVLQTNNHP